MQAYIVWNEPRSEHDTEVIYTCAHVVALTLYIYIYIYIVYMDTKKVNNY